MKKILKGFIFGLAVALIYLLYFWATKPIVFSNSLNYRIVEVFFIPTFPGVALAFFLGLGDPGLLGPHLNTDIGIILNFFIYLFLFWSLWIIFKKDKS